MTTKHRKHSEKTHNTGRKTVKKREEFDLKGQKLLAHKTKKVSKPIETGTGHRRMMQK